MLDAITGHPYGPDLDDLGPVAPPMSAYEPDVPLEHPVLPGQLIPLQLFEPRYLALAEHLHGEIEADFGIVGIERGREVGGDDVRADVGVVVRAGDDPSSRRTGLDRRRWHSTVKVNGWLDDAPYPAPWSPIGPTT